MTRDAVLALLRQVATGALSPEAVVERLAAAPFESVGEFATVDHHRALRQGWPEVVYGEGKSAEQCVAVAERLVERSAGFLVTRADSAVRSALVARFPSAVENAVGRTVRLGVRTNGAAATVCVVTAGTTDLPVAEECAETLLACGLRPERVTDVGVAGVHRLLARTASIRQADAVVVIAGMDGALPSVVGGLVAGPVIAVPTSVGYGAAFGGLAPLLTMLNSCAAGVVVVNIDNGFGAAMAAARMLAGRTSDAA
ncbi:1-(5-phosphoribosyl)-5-amino-4-imidazole-carboxylate (AIR) carboxylase [Gemmatirosa kalamazoonensis]|uniref:1-(5-phosphoribosyl)-5-amino-4-imidazole-carboxylate (AIR) carboxylase n=1 Tax=Gemmatirosa kalamazoonensis TaxID=861299 RepID=W0RJG6_9BACT|nr:nickel pincer cofactor biosynthesis protein LarB [Gemmatirosa kalamazoonensis]AHG90921.1 1-(5-phosphoribosyl)-5-amino-4-imidazole-carboxylate (AIR) carboxylase [Gemmatirosa kalamazoonensis]